MTVEQKRIERAYQRAMNIRDQSPTRVTAEVEYRYSKAYRKAYRLGSAEGFVKETRSYLKAMREGDGLRGADDAYSESVDITNPVSVDGELRFGYKDEPKSW